MKSLDEMDFTELLDYWTGYACMEIGRGEFRRAISIMLQDTMRRSYEKGAREAQKKN